MSSLLISKARVFLTCYTSSVPLSSSSPQILNPYLAFSLSDVNMSKSRPAVFFPKPEPFPLSSEMSHHSSSRPSLTPFLLPSPPESLPLQSSLQICHIFPSIHLPSSEHTVSCFQAFSHMYSSLPKFHSCFKNPDQIFLPLRTPLITTHGMGLGFLKVPTACAIYVVIIFPT